MIQTYRCGDDRVGGGEDGNEVQPVEDDPVADGKAFALVDKGDGGVGCQVAAATVVEHRETIIIAFDEDADDGGDPAGKGDKGKEEDTDEVHGLPQGVADGEADAAEHIPAEPVVEFHRIFLAVEEGVGLFAEVGEQRSADDEHEVFEEGEVKEDEYEVDHEAAHDEEIIEDGAAFTLEKAVDAEAAEPGDDNAGRIPEEVHADEEQDGVEDTGDDDPLPQAVGPDEVMRFCIGLEGDNDFF